ncbi:type II toxin-antitoxin system Phd/YefM family antitoxin [Streptomyces sp. NPDC002928]|uniref:type II toxin-antitoxin system Phd/YefM family antitoxin n=1 Tax=Streptomyces sp. NPDC002928 TaxID=3154440 RepID=UPI0033A29AE3
MTEALSITRARPILGDLARRVAATREPVVLTDHGRAIATLMPLCPGQPVEDGGGPDELPCTERH